MATKFRFPASSAPLRTVNGVQFGILSPEEIKEMSVAHIIHPDTMDETGNRPKKGGLLDPRMGTIDRNFKCESCGEGMSDCPGHFGHIELHRPVFHPGFIIRVKKILECICFYCSRLKADPSNPNFRRALMFRDSKKRFKAIWEVCKSKTRCDPPQPEGDKNLNGGAPEDDETLMNLRSGCGHSQPLFGREALRLYVKFKNNDEEGEEAGKSILTPRAVLDRLKRITDSDLLMMGLSPQYARPEWMLLTYLPVPPPPVRPSITVEGSSRSEDDLTFKLSSIIKTNDGLKKNEADGSPTHIMEEYEALLQYHVATYMDNDIAGIPKSTQKSGRPVKSIRARLKGKEGRLRGNLMGKRVDFSARTVITGDPNISIDEVGVPRSIARNLTYPEMVTSFNIDKLQRLVRNGPTEHPGAKYVIRDTGERVDLRYRTAETTLQIGYCVERHLDDGDVVIFNRQPSLHKMSMMGHKVRVLPYSTFRLNLSVTSPYNADFDGDEMNMHVPQTEEARAEIREICMVPKQIISPQSNKPVMGIVQDSLCGVRKFTLRDCFVDKELMCNLVLWIPNFDGKIPQPAILKPTPLWTGKQLISLLIPKGINLTSFHSTHPDDEKDLISPGDTKVEIVDGDIMCGIICKKTVGASAGGLIHTMFNECGSERTKYFFNGCQTVVNNWLLQNGFSIGIGDAIADKATMEKINQTIETARQGVNETIKLASDGTLEPAAGMTVQQTFESHINKRLNTATSDAGKAAEKSLPNYNNVKQMVMAGSKGSAINIAQMSACVGQQNVEGKRIAFGFRDRTLPHFLKYDHSPESRGFVENSYLRGLTPTEFFFHAMGGREGLIDTAVKTAETGYIQRRLVKALEDVMVRYDGTVRNSLGQIIEFVYGEDGMDAGHIEKQEIASIRLTDDAFRKKYKLELDEYGYPIVKNRTFVSSMFDKEVAPIETFQDALNGEFEALSEERNLLRNFIFPSGDSKWPMPVNLSRLIKNAQVKFFANPSNPIDLHPMYSIKRVRDLLDSLIVIRGDDNLSVAANLDACRLFKILVRSTLSSKRLIEEFFLNLEGFNYLIDEVEKRFYKAMVNPGEMVGTLAAQSIGEPATQMTLNTFHFAGVSSKNVTLGVPRLKEIINVASNLKTPSMTVLLPPGDALNFDNAKKVQTSLEYCTLSSITKRTQIYYDPDPSNSVIEEDHDWLYNNYMVEEGSMEGFSKWVLRIEFELLSLVHKRLSLEKIAKEIEKRYNHEVQCTYPDRNFHATVIHCRVRMTGRSGANEEDLMEDDQFLRELESNMLKEIVLSGIQKINRVFIQKKNFTRVDSGTGKYVTKEEYYLETDGNNLKQVMALENIDHSQLYCNDIVEIASVLGIEAARNAILRELRNVIEFDGSYVNYRHLALLCDIMTTRGYLMAITRHGINRTESGALMRCSFEETVEILMEAAAVGEHDDCKGISENIMLGQIAPLGTGCFDILLDEGALRTANVPVTVQMGDAIGNDATSYFSDVESPSVMTPYDGRSPQRMDFLANANAYAGNGFSPLQPVGSPKYSNPNMMSVPNNWQNNSGAAMSPAYSLKPQAFGGHMSPGYSPASPLSKAQSPRSPNYSPNSPSYTPAHNIGRMRPGTPSMSMGGSDNYSPTSPGYKPSSPSMMPPGARAGLGGKAVAYSPTSPTFSPTSPQVNFPGSNPTNFRQPGLNPNLATGKAYSPTSPTYSPTSPNTNAGQGSKAAGYSPASPTFSPTSPSYQALKFPNKQTGASSSNPSKPKFTPSDNAYSPNSPSYTPSGQAYSPTSPNYSVPAPTSPGIGGIGYSPTSPIYTPTSPSISTGFNSGMAPRSGYSTLSPSFNPTSPAPAQRSTNMSGRFQFPSIAGGPASPRVQYPLYGNSNGDDEADEEDKKKPLNKSPPTNGKH